MPYCCSLVDSLQNCICVLLSQYKIHIVRLAMNIKARESEQEDSEDHQTESEPALKNQVKPEKAEGESQNLVYQAEVLKVQKMEAQAVKQQLKTENKGIKYELKGQDAKKNDLFFPGQKDKKKDIETLAYPPPQKCVPLRNTKQAGKEERSGQEILSEAAKQALFMIRKMKKLYKLDLESFGKGEMAFRKVKYLSTLSQKLSNVYLKKEFIEQKGLKQFQCWLEKIINEQMEQFEPSLTIKLGLTKILREMNLNAEQIQKTKSLMSLIQRNRMSQVQELRELSSDLIKQWQYVIMTDLSDQNKK